MNRNEQPRQIAVNPPFASPFSPFSQESHTFENKSSFPSAGHVFSPALVDESVVDDGAAGPVAVAAPAVPELAHVLPPKSSSAVTNACRPRPMSLPLPPGDVADGCFCCG